MVRHSNHYEAAFEDYIYACGWPYVPVDQQKKALFAGAQIKSFDFIVYSPNQSPWLVDVKGRKFPYDGNGGKRYWENWVTRDDLAGLLKWKSVFGEDFVPGLMFAYWLLTPPPPDVDWDVHRFQSEHYAFLWIPAADYHAHARRRSPQWDTLSMPTRTFRRLARPLVSPRNRERLVVSAISGYHPT